MSLEPAMILTDRSVDVEGQFYAIFIVVLLDPRREVHAVGREA